MANRKFKIIGTNPSTYLEKYMKYIDDKPIGFELKIDSLSNKIYNEYHAFELSFSSNSVMRQNIDCWKGFGLFIKTDKNKIIKSKNPFKSFAHLEKNTFEILFVEEPDESINQFRFNIIMILLQFLEVNVIEIFNLNLNKNDEEITKEKILKQLGKFERGILANNKQKKVLLKYKELIVGDRNE